MSLPTLAILDAYQGSYGNLTHNGQARLIRILECIQSMRPAEIQLALAEIRELEPTL